MITVTLNGTDISGSVGSTSIDLVTVLTKENSSLTFTVSNGVGQTYPSVIVPVVGNTVEMSDSSGIIFGGTVTQVETTIEGLRVAYQVTCSDWGYLFDGTLVAKTYAGMDPADIVADLVATFCGSKGFTTNHVQRGNFIVPSIKFNYQQPTKCLQSLANLIGWDWYIDPSKDVHFFLGDVDSGIGVNGPAPVIVSQDGGNSGKDIEWNSLDIDLNMQNMQNSCYVIGGTTRKYFIDSPQPNSNPPQYAPVDIYQTDGVKYAYALAYSYSEISVFLDGTQVSVGIDQQDNPDAYQCMYNTAGRFLVFPTPPVSGQTLKIEGFASIPIVAFAKDASSITTYGEYQTVIADSKIITVAEAQARARAAILQFGHPVYDLKVTTLVPGCQIGQAVYVNLPAFGISGKWLVIKRIETTVRVPGLNGKLAYQLECIGSDSVTFVDIMSKLLQQQASQTNIEDSTITQILELAPDEALSLTESLTATSATATTLIWGDPSGNSKWGFSVWS